MSVSLSVLLAVSLPPVCVVRSPPASLPTPFPCNKSWFKLHLVALAQLIPDRRHRPSQRPALGPTFAGSRNCCMVAKKMSSSDARCTVAPPPKQIRRRGCCGRHLFRRRGSSGCHRRPSTVHDARPPPDPVPTARMLRPPPVPAARIQRPSPSRLQRRMTHGRPPIQSRRRGCCGRHQFRRRGSSGRHPVGLRRCVTCGHLPISSRLLLDSLGLFLFWDVGSRPLWEGYCHARATARSACTLLGHTPFVTIMSVTCFLLLPCVFKPCPCVSPCRCLLLCPFLFVPSVPVRVIWFSLGLSEGSRSEF
nr:uncharacterized protein LOC125984810 [Syngnathus scovelli]XP_049603006.1 uncharacterized protein LOC125984810 [Syngnathus scovelli]XP_049603017.1 uncharacterized protein LOC125984810 [Syngnathus scovelli]XP_049603026.1 uncharacterized protein LOC125984810 [Syngnathus scovelli]XP_049603034.1 uncharacterized protein LOC125984810 [Syngnathus scovelli]XP_049603044.1 uncharacterized protein LOC125984810 [Syngnathus scovelli]XP_049603052.1 uncharacterized protein LOC125984810 [Syngnathus scovell